MKPHILWAGATNNKGYGHRWIDGVYWLVHRYAFKQANGYIPKGKQVRHLCGIKLCIEPTHLALGAQSDNEQDKKLHGTFRHYAQYGKRINGVLIPKDYNKKKHGVPKAYTSFCKRKLGKCLPSNRKVNL